jgi:hypothetical protein
MMRIFIKQQLSVHQQRRQQKSGRLCHSNSSSSSSSAEQQTAANAAAAAAATKLEYTVTGVHGLTVDISAVNAAQLQCSFMSEYTFHQELSGEIPQSRHFNTSGNRLGGFTSDLILQSVVDTRPAVEVVRVEQQTLSDIVRDGCGGLDFAPETSVKVQARAQQFKLADGLYGSLAWSWRVTKPPCSSYANVTVDDVLVKLGSSSCRWQAGVDSVSPGLSSSGQTQDQRAFTLFPGKFV